MTVNKMRPRHSKTVIAVLALILASGNVLLSNRSTNAQGIDFAGIDKSIDPGDDFFGYANGAWSKAVQIPPDRPSFGAFDSIAEKVNAHTAELIKGAGKSTNDPEARKIGDYYDAFMDESAIEKKGLAPLKAELDEINGISDKSALARILGSQLRADVDPLNSTNFYTDRLFGIWISPNFNNPTHNVPYLLQGGLGLPDRDNYLGTEKDDVELQARYREHIVTILKLAQIADAESMAGRIYDLEKMLATAHASRTDSADVQKANNPWAMKEFSAKAPGLDWASYFKAAGLSGQPTIIVWQPGGVTGISALVGNQPLDVWKEYLVFHAIDRASGLLPKPFATERFKFYGTTLNGIPQQSDRWKRAVNNTSAALGDAVGKLYVKQYFPPDAKVKIQAMVKKIIAAFGRRIDNLTWMTPATRAKAKAKLGTLYVGVGYPEHWRDYSGLRILRDDPVGNAERSALFDYQWSLSKLSKPVDNTEWWMTPQTVNAVNLPIQNGLNFPAAILNPPFFDPQADPSKTTAALARLSVTRSVIALTIRVASSTPTAASSIGGRHRISTIFVLRPTGWRQSLTLTNLCRVCT
jgi:putative endopeptidase